jgi:flagellar hook-length control protein FliK
MKVTSTESPACTSSSAASHARDAGGTAPGTDADAAAFFLGLLAQAAAAPATGLPAPAAFPAAGARDAPETEVADAPVEWVMPFLPPATGAIPPPLDEPALPASGTADDMALVTVSGRGAAVAPPPAPLDDPLVSKDPGVLVAPDSARAVDASESAAIAGAPRVEAANGGSAQVVVRHIPVAVSDRRWPEQVGHEVRILVERGVQAATLRLTPEHLGPVDVRIDIVNDKANVVFGAANGDTRAALTEAIPRLREMFAGAGLTLGDAGVRQDTPGRSPGSGPDHPPAAAAIDGEAGPEVTAVQAVRMSLVDAYA